MHILSNLKTAVAVSVVSLSTLLMTACQTSTDTTSQLEPTETRVATSDYATLEVIGVYSGKDGEEVTLTNLTHDMRFTTIISIPNLGDNYVELAVGDRVKIAGDYAESDPVQIINISHISKVANPDKQACEATAGNVWRPEGMAQIPTCISTYSDAGKQCDSSDDCQGSCMVTSPDEPAVCAADSSPFGCGSSIEDFNKHGGIMCVD